jgi:hypothetical protein
MVPLAFNCLRVHSLTGFTTLYVLSTKHLYQGHIHMQLDQQRGGLRCCSDCVPVQQGRAWFCGSNPSSCIANAAALKLLCGP